MQFKRSANLMNENALQVSAPTTGALVNVPINVNSKAHGRNFNDGAEFNFNWPMDCQLCFSPLADDIAQNTGKLVPSIKMDSCR